MEVDKLTEQVIGLAIEVHRHLGPGLLESAYQECLYYELKNANLKVERELKLPIEYKEIKLDHGYKIDLLIEGENDAAVEIVEFKASTTIMPDLFKGLNYFEQLSGWKNLKKCLVYGGNTSQNRTAGKVVPWKKFGI